MLTNIDREILYGLDPVIEATELAKFAPDETQCEILRSTSNRIALNCTRQYGKSTIVALIASIFAKHHRNGLCLITAPTQRQSKLIFAKVKDFMYRIDPRARENITKDNVMELYLRNGTSVVSLPGEPENLRGYSAPDLIIVDEAAYAKDELFIAMRPMLATNNGRLILLSTPFGRRGFFWRVCTDPVVKRRWTVYTVTADQCHRISREYLEEERELLGDYFYRQEYGCEFLEAIDAFFDMDLVRAAMEKYVEPLVVPGIGEAQYGADSLNPIVLG
jgi:hypothetical protein